MEISFAISKRLFKQGHPTSKFYSIGVVRPFLRDKCSFLNAKKNVSVQERMTLHPLLICSDTQAELSNFRKF